MERLITAVGAVRPSSGPSGPSGVMGRALALTIVAGRTVTPLSHFVFFRDGRALTRKSMLGRRLLAPLVALCCPSCGRAETRVSYLGLVGRLVDSSIAPLHRNASARPRFLFIVDRPPTKTLTL